MDPMTRFAVRHLPLDGWGVAFPSTEPHEVRAKPMNPHQGLTSLTELKVSKTI